MDLAFYTSVYRREYEYSILKWTKIFYTVAVMNLKHWALVVCKPFPMSLESWEGVQIMNGN